MREFDWVEHKDKTSRSVEPHDKRYYVRNMNARMKDFTTGKWYDAVIYESEDVVFYQRETRFFR